MSFYFTIPIQLNNKIDNYFESEYKDMRITNGYKKIKTD